MAEQTLTLNEAAEIAGVSPATLRRWRSSGLIPQLKGRRAASWTAEAASHARLVARLRERGHRLDDIRSATDEGRLASHRIEQLFPEVRGDRTVDDAADLTGLEPALIERFWASLGLPTQGLETMTDEDLQALQYAASMLSTGFPLVAFLQLARVYGQALRQIADAEVRLFHLYVHEPLMREGVPGIQMAEQMEHLARDLLPMASPLMDFVHQRFLQHYIEQDVVGHMEIDRRGRRGPGPRARGHRVLRPGGLHALHRGGGRGGGGLVRGAVRRGGGRHAARRRARDQDDRRRGDDRGPGRPGPHRLGRGLPAAVRASGPSRASASTTARRCTATATTSGARSTLASRVVARARGGEVLVTDAVVERVSQSDSVEFEGVGQVKLKGFDEPRRLFRAAVPGADGD